MVLPLTRRKNRDLEDKKDENSFGASPHPLETKKLHHYSDNQNGLSKWRRSELVASRKLGWMGGL